MTTTMTNKFRRLVAAAAALALFGTGSAARAADPQPEEVADGRASRWTGQSARLANRKDEAQDRSRQLRAEIDRQANLGAGLEQERDRKVEKMLKDTLEFAGKAETNGGGFLRGLAGGAATRLVADEYNKAIGTVNSNITTLRKNQGEWEAEARRVTDRNAELAAWPTYKGHRYPVVEDGEIEGVAKGLDIRKGDLFLSYNGASMAYATGADLTGPRDEAARNGVATVEAVFVRDGKLIKHTVTGGKPLGVLVKLPISE